MITNKERRDVAARLRDYDNLRESLRESPICAFLDALGVEGYMDWKGVCNLFADFIEPERICRMEYREGTDKPFCSNCGEEMDAYTCEWTEPMEYSYPFCYACGAKVQS